MDTTETYIAQCDCPEIQGLFPNEVGCIICGKGKIFHYNCEPEPEKGIRLIFIEPFVILDPLSEHDGHLYHTTAEFGDGWGGCEYFNKVIWLPRQDQLQEMVWEGSNIRSMVLEFADFVEASDYRRESMEQLWLAFVMKEKFNKVWVNDKWEVK